jgi:dynamin GTPase
MLITMSAHNAITLKAESMSDKTEWVTKIKSIIDQKGVSVKKPNASEGGTPMKQSHSDGSLVRCKTLHVCFVN